MKEATLNDDHLPVDSQITHSPRSSNRTERTGSPYISLRRCVVRSFSILTHSRVVPLSPSIPHPMSMLSRHQSG